MTLFSAVYTSIALTRTSHRRVLNDDEVCPFDEDVNGREYGAEIGTFADPPAPKDAKCGE